MFVFFKLVATNAKLKYGFIVTLIWMLAELLFVNICKELRHCKLSTPKCQHCNKISQKKVLEIKY